MIVNVRFAVASICSLLLLTASASALEDPTRPPGASDAAMGKSTPSRQFTLSSVMIGPERRAAVIDGEPRGVGDVFEGVRVRAIGPDGVELVENGEIRVLRLEALPGVRSVQ